MNIAICMWYDNNISCYADKFKYINQKYCDKNNYNLIFNNKTYLIGKEPSYQKLPFLLEILTNYNYDYVMWIDADAHFNNYDKLDKFICPCGGDIIFSQDISGGEDINCGVMIFKNTEYSKNFLNYWINNDIKNPYPHWWEQGILRVIYAGNIMNIKEHSHIVKYGLLQSFTKYDKNALITHLAGVPHNGRLYYSNLINII